MTQKIGRFRIEKGKSINATHVLFENQELLKLTHQLEVFQ